MNLLELANVFRNARKQVDGMEFKPSPTDWDEIVRLNEWADDVDPKGTVSALSINIIPPFFHLSVMCVG